MVKKHGSYITTATAKFPTSGPEFKAKIGFLSDSTTAIGRWKALTIPIGDIEHLSAKSRRFFNWADICAGTRYWPFTINHLSGDKISLPHMLSHLGDLAKTKAKQLKAAGITAIVAPMFIHSCMLYQKVHKVYRVEEVEEEKKEEKPEAKSRPKLEEFIIKPVIGNARIGDDASESLMQWLTN